MKRPVTVAALTPFLLLSGAPAHADTRWGTAVTAVPHFNADGLIECTAKAITIGWGNTATYKLTSTVQRRYGVPGHYRWISLPPYISGEGDLDTKSIAMVQYAEGRYRCRARLSIIHTSNGVVVKRSGPIDSPARNL